MSFQFKQQLKLGQLGESLFYQAHCGEMNRTDGFKGDFVYKDSGKKLELKTDFWSMDSTANFFIERYSNASTRTPGGPWQALAHGAEYFVYFYVTNMTYFQFEVRALIDEMEKLIPLLDSTEVRNATHVTLGYRVPRSALAHLAKPMTLTVSVTP